MAACADSCITSPSLPVVVSLPRPSMIAASVVRIDPPTSVQARPVVAPTSFFLSVCLIAELLRPQQFVHLRRVDDGLFSGCLSCRFAGLRIDHGARDLAADVADLALQIANARFARVVLDQLLNARRPGTRSALRSSPVSLRCFGTRKRLAISIFSSSV